MASEYLKPDHLIKIVAVGRLHHDPKTVPHLQPARDRDAVLLGHADVEYDEIIRPFPPSADGARARFVADDRDVMNWNRSSRLSVPQPGDELGQRARRERLFQQGTARLA